MTQELQAGTVAPIQDFGPRFVAEAVRLGVPLSALQVERLSRASRGQIISAAEKRLPSLSREALRLVSGRGPESLARELSRSGKASPGLASQALDVVSAGDAVNLLGDIVGDVFAMVDVG